jgi:hypothetical protein
MGAKELLNPIAARAKSMKRFTARMVAALLVLVVRLVLKFGRLDDWRREQLTELVEEYRAKTRGYYV